MNISVPFSIEQREDGDERDGALLDGGKAHGERRGGER